MDIEATGAVDTDPGRPEVPATADSAHAAAPDEAVVGVPADEDPARSATPGAGPSPAAVDGAAPADTSPSALQRARANLTRRRFLGAGGAGIAAIGMMGALPSLFGAAEDEAPAIDGAASAAPSAADAAAGDSSELVAPLTAHVADLSTGEVSIFVENRTITLRDPALALRLLQAGR